METRIKFVHNLQDGKLKLHVTIIYSKQSFPYFYALYTLDAFTNLKPYSTQNITNNYKLACLPTYYIPNLFSLCTYLWSRYFSIASSEARAVSMFRMSILN